MPVFGRGVEADIERGARRRVGREDGADRRLLGVGVVHVDRAEDDARDLVGELEMHELRLHGAAPRLDELVEEAAHDRSGRDMIASGLSAVGCGFPAAIPNRRT
jgi:hypothetical protein